MRFAKWVVIINAAVPLVLLAWDAFFGQLGANAVNFAIHTTGLCALLFIFLSLAITPLRRLSHWGQLLQFRRALGVYSFVYAAAHFAIFFIFDRAHSVTSTLSEMWKRPYLIVGSIALFLLAPLAITSTNAMVKRLGGKRWRQLHKLTYVAAALGTIHYYMQVKADVRQPLVFLAVLALLFGYRIAVAFASAPIAQK